MAEMSFMSKKPLTLGQIVFAIVLAITFLFLISHGGLLLLIFWPYFAPALIAAFVTRQKRWWAIATGNVLFGWTGIGWIFLFWLASVKDAGE